MHMLIPLAAEATFGGMTVADWVALLTFIISIIGGIWCAVVWVLDKKLIQPLRTMIDKLSLHIDQSDANMLKRDRAYDKLQEKVAKHDRQFVRDEGKISELFDELRQLK